MNVRSGRMSGVLNARAFRIVRTRDPCRDFDLNARAFRISRRGFYAPNALNGRAFMPKSGRGAGVLNITNARAFRAPDPCPDFVPNTRAFRISTILFRVQNVLNGRAFGAKSGRGAGFLNILHASAFGIFRTSNPRPDFALTARAFVIFRTS